MDVTRKEFFDLLPELESAIEKALFISIDGEFTGIDNGKAIVKHTPYDPPHEVYTRYFQRVVDFLLIQFGMCVFYYDEETNRYTHQAYNFYVFPQSNNPQQPDPVFQCQSSSLAFLALEGFDFNKLFREGIPYLSQEEEDRKRSALGDKWKTIKNPKATVPSEIPVPKDKEQFIQNSLKQTREFLGSCGSESLSLSESNPFIRKILCQEIEKEFGDSVILRPDPVKKDGSLKNERGLLVFRATDKSKVQKFDEETEMQEQRELDETVGFSHVIKMLSKSGKLIVGHNMLLDVCHTVNRFVHSIPDNYHSFKSLLHKTFPRLIDTKVMTSVPPLQQYFSSTSLQGVQELLSAPPFKIPDCDVHVVGRGYSTLKAKEHEAGYDAYVTGLCFIALCDYLKAGGLHGKNWEEIIEPYENRVYIWAADAPYIQIGKADPNPPRGHVFHLEYPHEYKRQTIQRLFEGAGPINVSFLTESRAYVALYHRNKIPLVSKIKEGIITRYDSYHSNGKKAGGSHDKKGKNNQQSKKGKSQDENDSNDQASSSTVSSTNSENSSKKKQNSSNSRKRQPASKDNNEAERHASSGDEVHSFEESPLGTGEDNVSIGLKGGKTIKKTAFSKPPPAKLPKIEFEINDNWD